MADYRLWVNAERTVRVEMWPDRGEGRELVIVAVRDTPADVWGPPIHLAEERVNA